MMPKIIYIVWPLCEDKIQHPDGPLGSYACL